MFEALDRQLRINRAAADLERRTAVFVGMVGGLAQVLVGDSTINVPCVGFSPPTPGLSVQLERRNGQYIVIGPAVTQNPVGTITGTGSPKASVTVDGVAYAMAYQSGYTPVVNDQVVINWAWPGGIIMGAVTAAPQVPSTGPNGNGGVSLISTVPVLAADSGQYRSRWQSNDVRASDTVSGAWFYGSSVQDALRGSSPSSIEIYLPLQNSPLGACSIGVHTFASKPGGNVSASSLIPLSPRSGWVPLPVSFATFLRDNTGGIAVVSGNGDNQWAGTQSDSLSGALRFAGTR